VYIDRTTYVTVTLSQYYFSPDPRGKDIAGRFRIRLYRQAGLSPEQIAVQDFASYLATKNSKFSVSRLKAGYYWLSIEGTAGFGRTIGYATVSGSNTP
jgi:hypothetical protein